MERGVISQNDFKEMQNKPESDVKQPNEDSGQQQTRCEICNQAVYHRTDRDLTHSYVHLTGNLE